MINDYEYLMKSAYFQKKRSAKTSTTKLQLRFHIRNNVGATFQTPCGKQLKIYFSQYISFFQIFHTFLKIDLPLSSKILKDYFCQILAVLNNILQILNMAEKKVQRKRWNKQWKILVL